MERALLRERIGAYRHRHWQLKNEGETLEKRLVDIVDPDLWETINRITSQQAEKVRAHNTKKKEKKWLRLTRAGSQGSGQLVQTAPEYNEFVGLNRAVQNNDASDSGRDRDDDRAREKRLVVNLSDVDLTDEALDVLRKGLNYAITPKRIPIEELVTSVEAALGQLDSTKAEEIRLEAAYVIKRAKPPKENITWAQRKALKELKKREDIVITRADKGNATVVMDRAMYENKMEELLDPTVYQRGIKDPTRKIENAITRMLKSEGVEKKVAVEMAPGDARIPRIYGLPKIHKEGTPLRPIVSMIGAPTYKASKGLARRLKPFVGKTFSHVKNSTHLVQILKEHRLDDGDILASFDVTSLFTCLPVQDILKIIKEKKMLEGKMMELAELVLTSCYFQYKDVVYKQKDGVAMGSPLSSVVADVFMEEFETRAIEAHPKKPSLWLRYVDDVFVIWPHGEDALDQFLTYLNGVHPAIKFTLEKEAEGRLAFLDLLVCREDGGVLGHKVYRKPTATGRYLHADSHHHPAQKRGVIRTLVDRAVRLSSNDKYLKEELARLEEEMRGNGYRVQEVRKIAREVVERRRQGTPIGEQQEGTENQRIGLPYIRGVTEKLSRLFSKHGVQVAAKPVDKLGEVLGSTKDRQWLQDQGVYLLPCDCGTVYVGQTGKKVATRIGQHCADYRLQRTKTSAVARHGESCSGQMLFDQARVLAKEDRLSRRLIREAIEICKRPFCCNQDDGASLPPTWRPVVERVREAVPNVTDRVQDERPTSSAIGAGRSRRGGPERNKKGASGPAGHLAASDQDAQPES